MDAFIPNASTRFGEYKSAEFEWWSAQLKPGLTDSHVTVREASDWSTRDTRASFRAALELASLEKCAMKSRSLADNSKLLQNRIENDEGESVGHEARDFRELEPYLPPKDTNTVIRLTPDKISHQKWVAFLSSLSFPFPKLLYPFVSLFPSSVPFTFALFPTHLSLSLPFSLFFLPFFLSFLFPLFLTLSSSPLLSLSFSSFLSLSFSSQTSDLLSLFFPSLFPLSLFLS